MPAALATIDVADLPPVERVAYEVFAYRTHRELERHDSGVARIQRLTPLNASFGLHLELPDYVSGAGAPFRTVADYEAGLQRLSGYAGYLGSMVARLEEGLAAGYVQPQVIARQVVAQSEALLALPDAQNPFLAALARMPASFDAATRARFERAYPRRGRARGAPRLRAAARLPERSLPATRHRGARSIGDEGRRTSLCQRPRAPHHAAARRSGGSRDRHRRGRADPRPDGGGAAGSRVRRSAARVLRARAHRSAVLLHEARGPGRTHGRDRGAYLERHAEAVRAPPAGAVQRAGAAGDRQPARHRLLQARPARRRHARRAVVQHGHARHAADPDARDA